MATLPKAIYIFEVIPNKFVFHRTKNPKIYMKL